MIFTGTSGFGYKEWKGIFYPEKISPREMLHYYSQHFSSVEINNTFYRMPTEHVLSSWAEQVPDDFLFAIKAPQVITHLKRLRHVESEVDRLFSSISVLGKKLGAVLFQFPQSFPVARMVLEDFLALLPPTMPCAFDFRNPSWLDAGIQDLLHAGGYSLCSEDTDENPAKIIHSTTTWGYLRLRRSDYTASDLLQWRARIYRQNWERTFLFFKHEGEAKGPETAMAFRNLAGSAGN